MGQSNSVGAVRFSWSKMHSRTTASLLVQTLNDARILISGSQDLFSDKFFDTNNIETVSGQK